MWGIIPWVLIGTSVALGLNGAFWYWCLPIALVGVPTYYAGKSMLGASNLFLADISKFGVVKWVIWSYGSQLATTSLFYGVGWLIKSVF